MTINSPLYNITSLAKATNGDTLFLTADQNGNVFATSADNPASQLTSQWLLCYDPDNRAVIIVNASSGQALTAANPEKGSTVTTASLQPVDPITSANSWNFSGLLPWAAIRPFSDHQLNLNIKGDNYSGPTPVILWPWDEKHPEKNSQWAWNLVTATQAARA